MHHPAEDDGFVGGATEEIVQQVADVVQYHRFGFLIDQEGIGVPAPVAVQKDTAGQLLFQLLADCGFPYPHGAAD